MTTLPPIIHVVDDDASFRSALGELLSACGYGVALYESAEQLLKTLPGGDPGCILLDVQMAGLSGPQLQDRLAELGEKVARPAPYLSLLENGKVEPKIGLIGDLADALDVLSADLLAKVRGAGSRAGIVLVR